MRADLSHRIDANDEAVDLGELLARLWSGRWWIAVSVGIFGAASLAAAFLMTPVYRASTVLVPAGTERTSLSSSLNSARGSLGGLAALAGVGLDAGDAATQEALAVLRSRNFTESFIQHNKLVPVLFPGKWDEDAGRWKVPADDQPTAAQAFKYFHRKVRTVFQDNKTGLVTLHIDWKDRVAATNWANELVQRLNAEMQRRAIAQADASVGFLQKELAATAVVDTRNAINRLMETQINQRMIANVTAEYAFRAADPAMVPDEDDPVRPRRLLLILLGVFSGLLVGVVAALLAKRAA